MSAVCVRDHVGINHLINSDGSGEFTFCGREYNCGGGTLDAQGKPAFGPDGEFDGRIVGASCNCEECAQSVARIRESIRGVRWVRPLRAIEDHDLT